MDHLPVDPRRDSQQALASVALRARADRVGDGDAGRVATVRGATVPRLSAPRPPPASWLVEHGEDLFAAAPFEALELRRLRADPRPVAHSPFLARLTALR